MKLLEPDLEITVAETIFKRTAGKSAPEASGDSSSSAGGNKATDLNPLKSGPTSIPIRRFTKNRFSGGLCLSSVMTIFLLMIPRSRLLSGGTAPLPSAHNFLYHDLRGNRSTRGSHTL